MVQEFHVVRCFSCQTFQVHQVKKIKKWNCKMCGEKQSLVKEYGRGSGAECRRHVQKLNTIRGELHEAEHARFSCMLEEEEEDAQHEGDQVLPSLVEQVSQTCSSGHKLELEGKPSSESRWSKYLSEPAEEEEPDEAALEYNNVYTGRRTYRSSQPGNNRNAGRRKRSWGFSRSAPEPAHPEHRGATAGRSAVKDPWIGARQRTQDEGKDDSQTSSWAESEISHDAAVTRNLPPAPEARPPPAARGDESEIRRSKWSRFLTAPREDEENDVEAAGETVPVPPVTEQEVKGQFPSLQSSGQS
ncbi:hypothetical protein GJAV_G00256400 [Gymnothorax javanicus]|nr:hypothetical protein GJAV_G00256400 [Gymnothorax javanicus]